MDNPADHSGERLSVAPSNGTGLTKTFLIGMVAPLNSVTRVFTRQPRPSWISKEFYYATNRPLRNICYALGLMSGVFTVCSGVYHAEMFLFDKFLKSPDAHVSAPLPSHRRVEGFTDSFKQEEVEPVLVQPVPRIILESSENKPKLTI